MIKRLELLVLLDKYFVIFHHFVSASRDNVVCVLGHDDGQEDVVVQGDVRGLHLQAVERRV